MPNLNIRLLDGKPIQSPSYNIRGTTSIGQGGSALILIDGVEGDPSLLNPNDIASVSMLKDAASASIYGARGAFGVVLITTKNPEKGKTSITYSIKLLLLKNHLLFLILLPMDTLCQKCLPNHLLMVMVHFLRI